jgi:hypothetical protein
VRISNPLARELARTRQADTMDRIARALVDAELIGTATLDALSAVRFLHLLEPLARSVPFAASRLCVRLIDHGSPGVRRALATAARTLARSDRAAAEIVVSRLVHDSEAPVRTAASRTLAALVATATDPLAVVTRWVFGDSHEREAMARARRELPAPMGTAPKRGQLVAGT